MNNLQKFNNGLFEVTAKQEDGQISFDAEQVAKNLGIVSRTEKNGIVYESVRWSRINSFLPQVAELQKGDFIPESLVYRLAFKASNALAEQFQDWLATEVIPTVRKTGGYVANDDLFIQTYLPQADEQTKTLFKTTLQTLKTQNEQIAALKPKALFADAVETSQSSVLVGELSKILKQNGVDIGQNRLFDWLRKNGFLIRQNGENFNLPTQRSMEQGLFEIKKRTINNPDGSIRTTRTPKVTGKGQIYFVNKFLSEKGA